MEKLQRKYGLCTAICMVVGTVIGSGLFFKAQNVLVATKGNLSLGIVAWLVSGLIMITCSAQFAVMATKYQKINGVVDYAEATCGKGYAYYLAWFMVNIYYPGMTSVLSWVSARYFGVLFGWDLVSAEVLVLAGFFLIASYALNVMSPKLAGKYQVSTTIIKFIPIVLMAIVGTVVGFAKGTLTDNFAYVSVGAEHTSGGLFPAIIATVFAYEGWIIATSINAELKEPKKNLPIALVVGAAIVVVAYILYYIGVAGGASVEVLMQDGATTAFGNIFGSLGGTLLNICIAISCLGTLNGLMVATTRGMYSISARGEGPNPTMFNQIDPTNNMPMNSSVFGLLMCAVWLLYFYGANLSSNGWFGVFNFDSSELPIVTIYAFYIPMFIAWMIKEKELPAFKRFVLPMLSIVSCLFMIFATVYAHGVIPYQNSIARGKGFVFPVFFYLIVFGVIMLLGYFCSSSFKNRTARKKSATMEEGEA
ncbi:MAG: amino acid permease [Clostridiales bacterium]|nr:amino acid permease [Clostridiales bacterium]